MRTLWDEGFNSKKTEWQIQVVQADPGVKPAAATWELGEEGQIPYLSNR